MLWSRLSKIMHALYYLKDYVDECKIIHHHLTDTRPHKQMLSKFFIKGWITHVHMLFWKMLDACLNDFVIMLWRGKKTHNCEFSFSKSVRIDNRKFNKNISNSERISVDKWWKIILPTLFIILVSTIR